MFDTISGDLLQKLKTFHYVLHYGSIGKAAAAAHRSPSSVSRQIQQLEEHLGVTLLLRRAGGALPTEEGRQLHAHTLVLFRDLEALFSSMGGLRDPEEISGTVRILAAPVPLACLFPAVLSDIRRLYPDITLELTHSYGLKQAMKALMAHDYHFAMAVGESFPPEVDFTPVFRTSTCLISPVDMLLPAGLENDPGRLRSLPFVSLSENLAISRFVKKFMDERGIRPLVRHKAASITCQIAMVRAGLGVALVDNDHLRALGERGVRVTPMPFFPPRIFGIIQRHHASQPSHVRAILELILARRSHAFL